MRTLTKQTIKPVVSHVKHTLDVNTGYYKFYHFTLDTYNGKNSFKGGAAYDLHGCYGVDNAPFDKYALNLETGVVLDLENYTPKEVMRVNLRTGVTL